MIVVTGAAGFIGSNLITALNASGYRDLVLADDFSRAERQMYYKGKAYREEVDRKEFQAWLREHHRHVQFIVHLGARTDTTGLDRDVFLELNLDYSKKLFQNCVEFGLPLIYASSSATYGLGEHGYVDSHEVVMDLKPLNLSGRSKNEFDLWVLEQKHNPFFWAGLKFFDVYGPNEYHKGRRASQVYHAFRQIQETGSMNLFRSFHPYYMDGGQSGDFIHVGDVVKVIIFLMEHRPESGLYNLGTGEARSYLDLANTTFNAMGKEPDISFIDAPEDIRDNYPYFKQADMQKLRNAGYEASFISLESGVRDYVQNYLRGEHAN